MKIDISKYLGIPFQHLGSNNSGVDCYGLLRLFYKTEFQIEIPDYEYDKNWCKIGFNHIREYYKKNWETIEKPIRYGVVGFQMPGYDVEHHLGIIMHDVNSFLHSPLNRQVCISRLSDLLWKKSISSFYRIKGTCQQK